MTSTVKFTSKKIFSSKAKITVYSLILITLVGILSYSNSLHGPFVFDDLALIAENKALQMDSLSVSNLKQLWNSLNFLEKGRPVAWASLILNYVLGGLNPFGYHLFNLLIHLITAGTIYLFIKLTLNTARLQQIYSKLNQEIALLCSLIFVAHPIQTTAVSYISQRRACLAALFFMLTLYCYAKARLTKNNAQFYYFTGSTLSMLLAFGSKQNTLTLPFFILIYEYLFLQKQKTVKPKWPYIIIGSVLLTALLGIMFTGLYPSRYLNNWYKFYPFSIKQRLLTQLRVIFFYLSLLIAPLPSRLNLEHDFALSYSLFNPTTTFICLVLLLGLIISSIYLRKKRPLMSFALIWFWSNLLLESSFLPFDLIFEYRLYLPSFGLFLLISIFIAKGFKTLKTQPQIKQCLKALVCVSLIIPLSFMTYQRNKVWQDDLLLWQDTVNKSPNKTRPRHNLAHIYTNRGQTANAIAQYQQILQINSKHTYARSHLAFLYKKQGNIEKAIAQYLEEIKQNPKNGAAYYELGKLYQTEGFNDKAIETFQKAIQIIPDFTAIHRELGFLYIEEQNPAQAIKHLEKSLSLVPKQPQAGKMLDLIKEQQKYLAPQ